MALEWVSHSTSVYPVSNITSTFHTHSFTYNQCCMILAIDSVTEYHTLHETAFLPCRDKYSKETLKNFANLHRKSNAMEPGASIKATSSIASLYIPCI